MTRMARVRAWVTAAIAAAAAGCGGGKEAPAAGGGPPAAPVEVAVARRDTVIDAIAATGQIEPLQSVELRPDVVGRISEILVREGSEVG